MLNNEIFKFRRASIVRMIREILFENNNTMLLLKALTAEIDRKNILLPKKTGFSVGAPSF